MNKFVMGSLVVGMLAVPSLMMAQTTATGTLTVSGTVDSSISMILSTTSGATFTGTQPDEAVALGSITRFGTPPAGFTTTQGAGSYTLVAGGDGIGVEVDDSNITSAGYDLTAQLSAAPPTGVVWQVAGDTLNNATAVPIGAGEPYTTTNAHTWTIQIPDALADATSIGEVITFVATAE